MAAALDVAALKATVQGEAALQAAVSVHEVGGGVEAAAHTRSAEHETAVHETRGARGGGVHEAVALEVAAHEVAAHEAAHEAVVTAAARRSRRGARGGGER